MGQRLKRGEVWTAAGSVRYVGKPRPIIIVQDERVHTELSITVCPCTSDSMEAHFIRVPIQPDQQNGLLSQSVVMVDKISTIPRHNLGRRIGQLSDADTSRVNDAILIFLGLAGR